MKRRAFIAGLGGTAGWSLVAHAQQDSRVRRVGVLMGLDENDPEARNRFSAFTQRLSELGWTDGRNLRMEVRWAAGNVDQMRMFAKELVDLRPNVILAQTTPVTAALRGESPTIPVVFVHVTDPIAAGFTTSLSRPSGNMTGFVDLEASMAGKWLELLTQIAPNLKQVAALFNPDTAPGGGSYYVPIFEAAAQLLKVKPIVAPVRSEAEIEKVITLLGQEPRGGLVVTPDVFTTVYRTQIIMLAAGKNVPAVYGVPMAAREGGLLSYGPNRADILRRSAAYIDRILRGATPSELPIQLPTQFEMVLNLKTAMAVGLSVPPLIQSSANELIE